MAHQELLNKVEELLSYEATIEELKAEAEAIRNSIKKEMEERETEELEVGPHIVRFTSVLSSRFDTKRFKEVFGEDLYKVYTKEIASRRFTIA